MLNDDHTIVAPSTPAGGAIALIRLSGKDAIEICDKVFRSPNGRKLTSARGFTLHYGEVVDPTDNRPVDDVLVSIFRAPHSYTGENAAEISCHGSSYIVSRIIQLLIRNGARAAAPGEFTIRAFLSGKLDLAQAEGVADIIASTDRASHSIAMNQMRGGYSAELNRLRDELLHLTALLELELDFSEEDVEFADRAKLAEIMHQIQAKIDRLIDSFALGNAIKEGVATAIVGAPNAGKSTLLNLLLKEDRAMVSEIAGTTRDTIEESINIDGIKFRFIDTAGIRSTDDRLEQMGIDRTFDNIRRATVVLLVCDLSTFATHADIRDAVAMFTAQAEELHLRPEQHLLLILNKTDRVDPQFAASLCTEIQQRGLSAITISARTGDGGTLLIERLKLTVDLHSVLAGDTIVSNARHQEALLQARDALLRALDGLSAQLPADLLSEDIRQVVYHIGTITGAITNDEVLGQIFSKFCIGK